MAPKSYPFLLIIFLSFMASTSFFSFSTALSFGENVFSDRFHALDPKDPVVVALGEFAVKEHNKQENSKIKFEKVLKAAGHEIPESKIEYGLIIAAKENNVLYKYGAVVLEERKSGKVLIAFRKV